MDRDQKSDAQASCTSIAPPTITTKVQLPTLRTYEEKNYYGAVDVANIIGVTKTEKN